MKAFFLAIPLLLSGAVALANAPAGSILVKTVAEQEQAAADGSLRLVPAAKVLPGREVVYTVTVENIGHDVARDVVVTNPVPEHTRYLDGSAFGPGTELTFSVDGGHRFAGPGDLVVRDALGSARAATPADYTHIRFVLKNPLNGGAVAMARYRTVVR
jgi:uncharacterized repeat protein (TIGR01451 family)